MALVNSTDILRAAAASKRIVFAFNVFNNESIDAAIKAAEDSRMPVIVSVNEPDLNHFGISEIVATLRVKAERARTDVILHLDHGMSYEMVAGCIRAGFTSVMIDPSLFRDTEAVDVVKRVVEFAHASGVSVESMVGRLKLALEAEGEGNSAEELTDPLKAKTFAHATGIDSLAVSVGTEHGSFLVGKKTEINMPLLAQIARNVDVPLVIHGGSAVSDHQLRELRQYRVGKMNIGSAVRATYRKALLEALQDSLRDIREANVRAQEAMYEMARHKIELLVE